MTADVTSTDDRRKRALHVACCVATITFTLGFLYPVYAEQTVPWYYPLTREWVWQAEARGLAMDFMGRCLFALMVAAPATTGAWALARYLRAPRDRVLDLFTAWAVSATLIAVLHFGWSLYFRHPVPAPLPDWYVPR